MPDPLTILNTELDERFIIGRELGRGGMATVYLAEERKHGREVAIKVLRPELAASVGAERSCPRPTTTGVGGWRTSG